MKQHLSILVGGLLAFSLLPRASAQATSASSISQAGYADKSAWDSFTKIKITTLKGEPLGHIQDLALDVPGGQIVEVLVVSDQIFGLGGKTVALPPSALGAGAQPNTFSIDMTPEKFAAAPKFDLSKWSESTQTDQVAAAYEYFGQAPKFLITGEAPGRKALSGRPLTALPTLDRMLTLSNVAVYNFDGLKLGRVQSFSLDLPSGRILNTMIQGPDANNLSPPVNHIESSRQITTVIPPMLLGFNAKHDAFLLDLSPAAYNEEPRIQYTTGAGGEVVSFAEQAATGPHTDVALVQGTSFRDIKITAQIYGMIQDSKLDANNVIEVGTSQGRVTLRGPVSSQATKDSLGAIAISVVRLDNVDNQIVVAPALQASI